MINEKGQLEADFTVNGFEFAIINDKECALIQAPKYASECIIGEIITDERGNDYTLVEIGDRAFYNHKYLVSVELPDTIRKIGANAFGFCAKLETVSLPDEVESIGAYCFGSCSSLILKKLPNKLNELFAGAFCNCLGLKSISIPDAVRIISEITFRGCRNLKRVKLPKQLKRINKEAFSGCESLERITIPNGTEELSELAFSLCKSLKSVKLPKTVSSIGTRAFIDCVSLETITMGGNIFEVKDETFKGCSSLATVNLPGTLKKIGKLAFYRSGLEQVSIPYGVESIEAYAFCNCFKLKKINIPDTVKYCGPCAIWASRDCVIDVSNETKRTLISCRNDNYCWSSYNDIVGNFDYELRYFDSYDRENRVFFKHIFDNYLNGMTDIRIAIIGGGNGWELSAINDCISNMQNKSKVECCIIDRVIWQYNRLYDRKYENISEITVIYDDYGDYLNENDDMFDLIYFSRCINYKDCGYANIDSIREMLERKKTLVAFAQIELSQKNGKTNQFNDEFKEAFGIDDNTDSMHCEGRTRLYVIDYSKVKE